MRAQWIVLVVALSGGCLRSTEYRCSSNSECGSNGTCESIGFCSFPDGQCASGERFGDSAGDLANQCTGSTGIDAGVDSSVDARPIDGQMIDAPAAGCPGNYATITGGQGTHRYRLIASANWGQQRDLCVATTASAYLAIPDDLAELQALATLANTTRFWVGITDEVTENTWLTVKGTAATYLPWVTGAPDNGPPSENCVEVVSATSQINDERCNTQYVAVCECEP